MAMMRSGSSTATAISGHPPVGPAVRARPGPGGSARRRSRRRPRPGPPPRRRSRRGAPAPGPPSRHRPPPVDRRRGGRAQGQGRRPPRLGRRPCRPPRRRSERADRAPRHVSRAAAGPSGREEEDAADPLGEPEKPQRPAGRGRRPPRRSHIEIEPPITVRSLSEVIGVRANDLIRKHDERMGQMVTINATLDDETGA